MFEVAKKVYKIEGFKVFYRGIQPAIYRQLGFGALRLGIYKHLYYKHLEHNSLSSNTESDNIQVPAYWILLYGMGSGFVAALVTNPVEMIMIRMQNDIYLSSQSKRNYNHGVMNALKSIKSESGFSGFYRGFSGYCGRVMMVNATQLTTFDTFKFKVAQIRGEFDDIPTRDVVKQ